MVTRWQLSTTLFNSGIQKKTVDQRSQEDPGKTRNTPFILGRNCQGPLTHHTSKEHLLQDGWIRKCKDPKELGGYTYYEFLLPAFVKEVTTNGSRFDIYDQYSSLQEALTREWLSMILFRKDSFPISVTLPRGEVIMVPSVLTINSQRRMRLAYKTFLLSTDTPFFEEVLTPPGMEISNTNARAAFTYASRLQGILVPYETMSRTSREYREVLKYLS